MVDLTWRGADWQQARRGLEWQLSLMGATLPEGDHVVETHIVSGEVAFQLDLARLGLDAHAREALTAYSLEMEPGEDLGRWLMRTLYEPWRYYELTGACGDVEAWTQGRDLSVEVSVPQSALIDGPRDFVGADGDVDELAWLVVHGREAEAIDLMPNGQQRYAIFGEDGELVPAAAPELLAGQPGKCAWCHEGRVILPAAGNDDDIAQVGAWQAAIDDWRTGLDTAIDYSDPRVHGYGERLVVDFLRPTPARVAAEWGWTEEAVRAWIAEDAVRVLTDAEYPDRGDVLRRSDVDDKRAELFGWEPLPVLDDERDVPEGAMLAEALVGGCR